MARTVFQGDYAKWRWKQGRWVNSGSLSNIWFIYIYLFIYLYSQILRQRCRNPGRKIIRATKFYKMAPNICEHSAGNFCMSFSVAWNFHMYVRFLGNLCTYVLRWRECESKRLWLNLACILRGGTDEKQKKPTSGKLIFRWQFLECVSFLQTDGQSHYGTDSARMPMGRSGVKWFCGLYLEPNGYGSGAAGWGTALQVGKSLKFFIDINLPAALWSWGWLSL